MAPYPIRFTVSEVPANVKRPPRLVCSLISFLSLLFHQKSSKRLSDQFLALLPERLCVVRIERIRPDAVTDCADDHIIRYDRADMAVLAVAASDFIGWGN